MPPTSTSPDTVAHNLDLKILAQLEGADTTIQFSSLPSTTTVAQLKAMIHDTAPLRPAIDRQRLIYKGHALSRDSETLATVIGESTLASRDPVNFHLVVRDLATGRIPTPTPQTSILPNGQHALPEHQGPLPQPAHPIPPFSHPTHAMFAQFTSQIPFPAHAIVQTQGINAGGPQVNRPLGVAQPGPPLSSSVVNGSPPRGFAAPPRAPDITLTILNQRAHLAALQEQQQWQLNNRNNVAPSNTAYPPANQGSTDNLDPPHSSQTQMYGSATRDRHQYRPQSQRFSTPQPASRSTIAHNGHSLHSTVQNATPTFGHDGQIHGQQQNNFGPGVTHAQPTITYNNPVQLPSFADPPNGVIMGFTGPAPGPVPLGPLLIPNHLNTVQLPWPPNPYLPSQQLLPPSWPDASSIANGFQSLAHARAIMASWQSNLVSFHNVLNRASQELRNQNELLADPTERFRQQLNTLVNFRNLGQQAINSALDPSSQVLPRASPNDVRELQSLNENFHRTHSAVCQTLNQMSEQYASHGAQRGATDGSMPSHSNTDVWLAGSTELPASNNQEQMPSIAGSLQDSNAQQVSTNSQLANVTAYLMTSTTGPCAIVYSDREIFTTHLVPHVQVDSNIQLETPTRNGSTPQTRPSGVMPQTVQQQTAGLPEPPPNVVQAVMPVNANVQANGNNQGQAQAGQQPEANEQARVVGQVFTHLWFLVRVCGLIWFFSNGTTAYRIFLLLLATTIYFAIQLGFFIPQWEQLRRHFESLLGLTNQQQQRAQAAHQPVADGAEIQQDNRPVVAEAQQGRPPTMVPQEVADRLLQEARERDQGRVRQWLRSLERGVALFFASFWPGLGERTIAAREQAQRESLQRIREATERAREAVEQVTQLAAQHNNAQQNHQAPQAGGEQGPLQVDPSADKQTEDKAQAATNVAAEGSSSSVQAPEAGEVRQRSQAEKL